MALDAVGVGYQRRLVDDHFLFGVGGVDEGQGVTFPIGVSYVGDVKAGRGGVETDDVAGLDVLDAFREVGLGNVPVVPGLEILLGGLDFRYVFRVVLELLVGSRVRRHEVEFLVERDTAALATDFAEKTPCRALDDPFGGVVEAGGVAVDLAATVAKLPQVVHILFEGGLGILGREREGEAHLHEEDAVGLACVDGQAFRLDLERAGHIGRAEEMLGYLDDQLGHRQVAVARDQVHHFLEVLHVFLRETGVAFFIGGGAQGEPEEGGDKYDDAFHNQKKASL